MDRDSAYLRVDARQLQNMEKTRQKILKEERPGWKYDALFIPKIVIYVHNVQQYPDNTNNAAINCCYFFSKICHDGSDVEGSGGVPISMTIDSMQMLLDAQLVDKEERRGG